jgi:hypothetical protein
MSLRDYISEDGSSFQFASLNTQRQVCSGSVVVLSGLVTVSQAALPAGADLPALGVQAVGCIAVCGAGAVAPFQPFQLVRVVA